MAAPTYVKMWEYWQTLPFPSRDYYADAAREMMDRGMLTRDADGVQEFYRLNQSVLPANVQEIVTRHYRRIHSNMVGETVAQQEARTYVAPVEPHIIKHSTVHQETVYAPNNPFTPPPIQPHKTGIVMEPGMAYPMELPASLGETRHTAAPPTALVKSDRQIQIDYVMTHRKDFTREEVSRMLSQGMMPDPILALPPKVKQPQVVPLDDQSELETVLARAQLELGMNDAEFAEALQQIANYIMAGGQI